MRTYLLLLICMLSNTIASFAQAKTGVWKGELIQNPNRIFYFEIRIDKATNDGQISGTTYIESYGIDYSQKGDFGTIEFTGTWKGNSIVVQETKIVKEVRKSSTYYWCIKKSVLTYKEENNQMVLSGPWTAPGGCVPGTVTVKKEMEKKVVKIDSLENRKVDTKFNITVESTTLTLDVWDHNIEDGDIISLNLNGEWILESHTIHTVKHQLSLQLTQKENILVLHAVNLGSSPPNTASMIINDGVSEQKLVLNSDKGKSEAILITVK